MAENPYVNRVEKADGTVIMDITDTTAEASDVAEGEVFYTRSGERSIGTLGDFTGATASTDGTHGLVPAPEAGEQNKVLTGAGTWEYMSAAAKEFTLDNVSNVSGSYSHTTSVSDATSDMKPIKIELGTPSAFNDQISVTCLDGSITLSCDDVSGSSTVKVTVLKQENMNIAIDDTAGEGDTTKVWSADKSTKENDEIKTTVNDVNEQVNGTAGGTVDVTSSVQWTSGGGVNYANGNITTTSSNYSHADIPLSTASHVQGHTRAGLEPEKGMVFLGDGDAYISGTYNQGGSSYDWNYSFDVPSGAKKLRICCATSYLSSFTCSLTLQGTEGLIERVDSLEELTGTDTTLTVSGKAADSKTVGDKFTENEEGVTTSYSGSYTQVREGNFTAGSYWRLKLVSTTSTVQYTEIKGIVDKTDTSVSETQFNLPVGKDVIWSPVKDYEAIKYAVNGSCVLEINDCSSVFDSIERKIFYCGPSRQYTKLIDAIEAAERYMGSVLYVDAGTYDLVEEFGEDYFANITTESMPGILLKNRIHIIFSPNSYVTCHYTGSNTNVLTNFSPFNAGQYGFTMENLNLSSSRVRYAVHDERNGKTEFCQSKYINCKMKHDNTDNPSWSSYSCIGGGLGSNHEVMIENCIFESVLASGETAHGVVYYHPSNDSNNHSFAAKLTLKDSYFVNGTLALDGARTDASIDTVVIFTNNSIEYYAGNASNGIFFNGSQAYQGTHYDIRAWNNDIRH